MIHMYKASHPLRARFRAIATTFVCTTSTALFGVIRRYFFLLYLTLATTEISRDAELNQRRFEFRLLHIFIYRRMGWPKSVNHRAPMTVIKKLKIWVESMHSVSIGTCTGMIIIINIGI